MAKEDWHSNANEGWIPVAALQVDALYCLMFVLEMEREA